MLLKEWSYFYIKMLNILSLKKKKKKNLIKVPNEFYRHPVRQKFISLRMINNKSDDYFVYHERRLGENFLYCTYRLMK